jgi:uncharacterized protein YutE (UPF0331/DUF86 family)
VDRDLLAAKLAELSARAQRAASHCPASADRLASDRDALDLVSFNLMLAVQSALYVASHLIADEGWEPATTLAESFQPLAANRVISDDVRKSMGLAAGLRNFVAHGYAQVDPSRVFLAATVGTRDLERFAAEVAAWATGRTTPSPGPVEPAG